MLLKLGLVLVELQLCTSCDSAMMQNQTAAMDLSKCSCCVCGTPPYMQLEVEHYTVLGAVMHISDTIGESHVVSRVSSLHTVCTQISLQQTLLYVPCVITSASYVYYSMCWVIISVGSQYCLLRDTRPLDQSL